MQGKAEKKFWELYNGVGPGARLLSTCSSKSWRGARAKFESEGYFGSCTIVGWLPSDRVRTTETHVVKFK